MEHLGDRAPPSVKICVLKIYVLGHLTDSILREN
jgi:hypothetical protein